MRKEHRAVRTFLFRPLLQNVNVKAKFTISLTTRANFAKVIFTSKPRWVTAVAK